MRTLRFQALKLSFKRGDKINFVHAGPEKERRLMIDDFPIFYEKEGVTREAGTKIFPALTSPDT